MILRILLVASISLAGLFSAPIEQIWLTHRQNEPSHIVIHWESAEASPSLVHYGTTTSLRHRIEGTNLTRLHKIEVPFAQSSSHFYYSVQSGANRSATYRVKTYTGPTLRVGVVADWQARPDLPGLHKDDLHLLLTAGDHISDLHTDCGKGVKDCWKPYSRLIAAYPALFRTVPIMPALGNHDREIRPRGPRPPPEQVYDVEATAFRTFFSLPGDGWKWRFEIPEFHVRFVALDLNHTSDQGTTWQTCHPFQDGSEQFEWYRRLTEHGDRPFVVTLHNERNSAMRDAEGGAWGRMFQKGSAVITGFGCFAERAEVNGFPYYNTALGTGDKYPDPKSEFLAHTATYLLIEFSRGEPSASITIKDLSGRPLDHRPLTPIRVD